MQLTCPNCDARYEVDASMIPAEGRDVQCSNCTTTWFQPGVDQAGGATEAEVPPPQPPVAHREATRPLEDEDEVTFEPPPRPAPAPAADEALDAAEVPQDDDAYPEEPPIPAEPPRRELAPEVRDVLRQEAEREAALRAQDAGGVEMQDEMPLAEEPEAVPEPEPEDELGAVVSGLVSDTDQIIEELDDAPRDRATAAAGGGYGGGSGSDDDLVEAQIAAAAASAGQAAAAGSRRDLLPDIEEINSTLRATNERGGGGAGDSDYETVETRPRRRAGTRLGFGLAVLIFAALVGVYSQAPRIAASLPQAQPILEQYVGQVDRLRGWITDVAQGALTDESATAGAGATVEPVLPQGDDGVTNIEDTAAQAPDTQTPPAPLEAASDN